LYFMTGIAIGIVTFLINLLEETLDDLKSKSA
jgi:hypothetical protein